MSDTANDGWHYLRTNDAVRYPRRIICLDSEASIHPTDRGEKHEFMLGVASYDYWGKGYEEQLDGDLIETKDYNRLWEWIGSYSKPRERTVVFAHNLGYDLRLTKALSVLPELGWKLHFISIDSERTFARFSRNGATLVMSDSTSYLPCSLERLATELGIEKLPLPEQTDDPDKWFARCLRDVEILRMAMVHTLKWLETNDHGNWRPTGPAQAFASFRHRFMEPRSLLIHRDTEALTAERRAGWTGRAEVWKWGEHYGPLHEWDFNLAYAHIAANYELPTRYLGTTATRSTRLRVPFRNGYATLYRVTVRSDVPIVPTSYESFIRWPIGEFETTLWDVEAALALENGAELIAHEAWLYKKSPLLCKWGQWIIGELNGESREADPITAIMLKHWARSLIGRFGIRYPKWNHVADSNSPELSYFECFDADGGDDTKYLQIAKQWFELAGSEEGSDSAPAVMSYIMALSRCQLWDAIQAAGESEIYYMDTDSLIVTSHGSKKLDDYSKTLVDSSLRHKGVYEHGIFYAPRAIVLDDEPRIAGLSKRAERTGNLHYRSRVWQRLNDSLRTGEADSIRVWNRPFQILLRDTRRQHLPNAITAPYELTMD